MTPEEANAILVALDRDAVVKGGFYEFAKLAWHHTKAGEQDFQTNWHIEEMCVHAEAITPPWHAPNVCRCDACAAASVATSAPFAPTGARPIWAKPLVNDLCVNVPPASTKSKIWSVLWQAWVWTWDPSRRFVCVSYADTVAIDLAEQMLRLIQSKWYRDRWPTVQLDMRGGRPAITDFRTTLGGRRFSTTVGGQLTGIHCDVLVVDDIVKPSDVNADAVDSVICETAWNWLRNTTASRGLDALNYARVLVGQSVRAGDPYELYVATGAMHLCFAAEYELSRPCKTPFGGDPRMVEGEPIGPSPRMGKDALDVLAARHGGRDSAFWAAQYQQRGLPPGGLIFKREYFRSFPLAQYPIRGTHSVLSVDANFKQNETSADIGLAVLGSKGPWVGVYDGRSERGGFLRALELIGELIAKWKPTAILIEDQANGPALIELLRKKFPNVVAIKTKDSKEARAWAASVPYKAGSVWHEASIAEWVGDQLAAFPKGRKKDFPDALTHAVLYLTSKDHTAFAAAMATWNDATARALGVDV